MGETNIENNVVLEEDLEEVAGGLHISAETLRDALIVMGVSVVGATAAGVWALDYVRRKKKKSSVASTTNVPPKAPTKNVQPHVYYHPLSSKETVLQQPGDKGFQTVTPELPKDFKLDD